MAKETYAAARRRLYEGLKAEGWTVSKPDLKVLWAEPPGRGYRIWLRAQAIHKEEHSTFLEMRGLKVEALIAWLEAP